MAAAREIRDETGNCHKQVTVHLGVLGGTIFSEQIFMDLDGWGFILDGDSFTAWGENLRQDAQLVLCLRNSAVVFGYASDDCSGVAGDQDPAG